MIVNAVRNGLYGLMDMVLKRKLVIELTAEEFNVIAEAAMQQARSPEQIAESVVRAAVIDALALKQQKSRGPIGFDPARCKDQ